MSDIDTAAVDSLKVLDPNRPIREATKYCRAAIGRYVPDGVAKGRFALVIENSKGHRRGVRVKM